MGMELGAGITEVTVRRCGVASGETFDMAGLAFAQAGRDSDMGGRLRAMVRPRTRGVGSATREQYRFWQCPIGCAWSVYRISCA